MCGKICKLLPRKGSTAARSHEIRRRKEDGKGGINKVDKGIKEEARGGGERGRNEISCQKREEEEEDIVVMYAATGKSISSAFRRMSELF